MLLTARSRKRTSLLCLMAWALMVSVQFVHAAHNPGVIPLKGTDAGAASHSPVQQDHRSVQPLGCDDAGVRNHTDHSHKAHNSEVESSSDHDLVHQLMECDCLVCKIMQLPALAPDWQSETLVILSSRISPTVWVETSRPTASLRPPGRAPPAV